MKSGDRIDKYVIERVLGEGGMATVYLARHAVLGSEHALKVLRIDVPEIRKRLLAEGRVQASLNHPNLVAVTDIIDDQQGVALVMEYVEGTTLEAVLDEGRLTPNEALRLFRDITLGIAEAHRHGLVHRDLKPGNILLHDTNAGRAAKVTDFGLVKNLAQSGTRSGVLMGTPEYMSPEQVRDSAKVDPRSDLWALGALLYEMLSGRVAFEAPDVVTVYTRIVAADYVPLDRVAPTLPPRVLRAVDRMLQVDLNDRFQDAAGLLAHLYPDQPIAPTATRPMARRRSSEEKATVPNLARRQTPPSRRLTEPETPLPVPIPPPRRALGSGFLVGGLVALVVFGGALAGLAAWQAPRPDPIPEVTSRLVTLEVEAEGPTWLLVGDELYAGPDVSLGQQEHGPMEATWVVGPYCDVCVDAPNDCPAWCLQEVVEIEVPPGDTPWTPTLRAPQPRLARVQVRGPEGSQVFLDGEDLQAVDGAAETQTLPGPHTVVVQHGTCGEASVDCTRSRTCPEGCASVAQALDVTLAGDPAPLVIELKAPATPEPVVVPEPAAPEPTTPRLVRGSAFASFVARNPAWEREAAIAAGKVDDTYLAGWDDGPPKGPATRLPWAAANAYCQGRGGLLPIDGEPLSWEVSSSVRIEWRQDGGRVAWRRFDGVTSTAVDPRQSMAFAGFRCRK